MRIARRDRHAVIAGMCLLLAPTILLGPTIMSSASAAAPTSAWRQANADGAKSNRVTGETTLTAANLASRGVNPSYSLAGLPPFGECGGFFGSPVPVTSTNRMFFYNGREIEARDLATGNLVWRSADLLGSDAISQVDQFSLSGGRIVASGIDGCESQSDPNGFVVALDASTGKQVWRHDTDQYIDDQTISGSTLVVVGESDVLAPDLLAAYRVSDGSPLWRRTNCTPSNIFVVAATVAAGSCGGVSLSTGNTLGT
jgi:outer membrane protein assembly factor BamB